MAYLQDKELEAIRHFTGTLSDFKNFFDKKAAETAKKDKAETNAYGTPEYQGFNDVHPTRGANKSPHWEESVQLQEAEEVEVTQEMWDKDWKIRKAFGKEYEEHFAKRIEAAMSKAKNEEMAENWALINWKQLPGKADGMTIKESLNEYNGPKFREFKSKLYATPPRWSKYVAQNKDGKWIWHENKPTMTSTGYKSSGKKLDMDLKTDNKNWNEIPTYFFVGNGKVTESVNEAFNLKDEIEDSFHLSESNSISTKVDRIPLFEDFQG